METAEWADHLVSLYVQPVKVGTGLGILQFRLILINPY